MSDVFEFAEVVFRADSCWVMASKPMGRTGPCTALGMFPSMRVAHAYMEYVREHHADEEFIANCDLFVQQYRSKDRKKR